METDHQIQVRMPDLVRINKKKRTHTMGFPFSADHRLKMKESKEVNKYLLRAKKSVGHESDSDTRNRWPTRYSPQLFSEGISDTGNQEKNEDRTEQISVEISKNTYSPGHLKNLFSFRLDKNSFHTRWRKCEKFI